MSLDSYDKLYKVIVLGRSSVGKTNLLLRYTRNKFDENSRTTIGVEFGYRDVLIDGCRVRLQIWDTAGQERFRATPQAYYRGAMGAVLVFDLTDHKSLESLCEEHWHLDLRRYADPEVCRILVGNKLDLSDQRQVSETEALTLANKFGMRYVETSAKQDIAVSDLFTELAAAIYEKDCQPRNEPVQLLRVETPSVRVKLSAEPPKRACC